MAQRGALRRRLVPGAAVLGCAAAAVLLTNGLGGPAPAGTAVAAGAAAAGGAAPAGLSARAPGALADLVPAPADWGYGWVADDSAASQQVVDGPGLLHPCGAAYASDAQREELSRTNVVQDEQEVPGGQAMTVELARYSGTGAQQALQERLDALRRCSEYEITFVGYPRTPVDVALLPAPEGGSSAAAHVAVTPSTSVGVQAVEYTYLVAQQGDVLLSAVVGNGNGGGSELDAFSQGYFHQARQKLAGLPSPSPELALVQDGGP